MQIDIEDIEVAAKELSPSGFKLYLYLAKNQDKYNFAYSPKDFTLSYGVSESSAKRAKTELIEKGYIITKGNFFDFYTNKEDTQESLKSLRDKINIIAKNLISFGVEKETLTTIINYYKKEGMSDKELRKAYNNILKDFQTISQKMDDIL